MTVVAALMSTLVATSALVTACPSRVAAGSAESTAPTYPNVSLTLLAGAGTPVGFAGAEAAFDPWSWLSLSTGMGVANLHDPRPASAATVRLRSQMLTRQIPAWLVLGYGLSRGKYTVEVNVLNADVSGSSTWQGQLWWHNFEAGIHWSPPEDRRLVLRGFIGWAKQGNPDALVCIADCNRAKVGPTAWPFVGVGLGWLLL